MKTSKNIKRLVFSVTFLLNVTLLFALFLGTSSIAIVYAQEADSYIDKIYSTATINDDFCDRSIIVVMDESNSQITTESTQQNDIVKNNFIFDNIGVKEIRDLTALPSDNVVRTSSNRIVTDGEMIRQHLSTITFRQILHIQLEVASKQNVLDTVRQLQQVEGIRYVGPNMFYEDMTPTPNDLRLAEQWALIGDTGIGSTGAWGITPGSRTVRVGVIDSGIAQHDDFVLTNEYGVVIHSNVDRDAGWDFFNNNGITDDDNNGHGTSSAGVVGAMGNNGIGVTGVAQQVTLVPLQTRSSGTSHSAAAMVEAVTHARNLWNTDQRISILTMSIGGFGLNTEMRDVIETYQGLFVWSAGNNGDNLDNFINIASFNLPNLIAVGGHNRARTRSIWNTTQSSSFGNAVDVYAPGGHQGVAATENMLTTTIGNNYRFFNGTSAAAPHVAGVAALMLSINPTLTAAQLKTGIINSATVDNNFATPAGIQTARLLCATSAVASATFTTNISGNNATITGVRSGAILMSAIIIPEVVNERTVTQISNSAFSNQTQLTQITIPSTVTHIGSDAFKNTNHASIYLTGRTKAPSTFNINWNSSVNPVYLNGNLCLHTSSVTTVSLNDTQHGNLCNDCRTVISKSLHSKYTSGNWEYCHDCSYSKYIGHTHSYTHTWLSLRQHQSSCSCGDIRIRPHIVSGDWNGIGYATCLDCGGPAELGMVMFGVLPRTIESLSSIYIQEYFGNGSLILSNGVIVLSDIDLEAYYRGTLVLLDVYDVDNYHDHDRDECSSECIDCDNHCHDCLNCESYCHDCVDCDDVYIYDDRRKTLYVPNIRREHDYLKDSVKQTRNYLRTNSRLM